MPDELSLGKNPNSLEHKLCYSDKFWERVFKDAGTISMSVLASILLVSTAWLVFGGVADAIEIIKNYF